MNGSAITHSCSTLPRAKRGRSQKAWSTSVVIAGGSKRSSVAESSLYTPLERHPSQANMWSTTVPQSLVNQTLGSRHAPTRNSLRHSRMLVLSRSFGGVVPRKYLPPVLERARLGTLLVSLQFILGLILTGFACYALIWSPTLAAQDLPHYSGLTFLLSGWCGLMLLTFCRHFYPGTRQTGCVFPVRPQYIIINGLLSFISFLFGLLSSCAHSLHLASLLQDPICSELPLSISSPQWLLSFWDTSASSPVSCSCNSSLFSPLLEYPGLPCSSVHSVLTWILGLASVFNLGGCLAALWFTLLLAKSRGKPPGPSQTRDTEEQRRRRSSRRRSFV